jgi:hypothetical protein
MTERTSAAQDRVIACGPEHPLSINNAISTAIDAPQLVSVHHAQAAALRALLGKEIDRIVQARHAAGHDSSWADAIGNDPGDDLGNDPRNDPVQRAESIRATQPPHAGGPITEQLTQPVPEAPA